jgi:hypothetical protein
MYKWTIYSFHAFLKGRSESFEITLLSVCLSVCLSVPTFQPVDQILRKFSRVVCEWKPFHRFKKFPTRSKWRGLSSNWWGGRVTSGICTETLLRQFFAEPKVATRRSCGIFLYFLFDDDSLGRDSLVGMVTRYRLDGPGIESRWGRDFPHVCSPALRPTEPPVQWVAGFSRG